MENETFLSRHWEKLLVAAALGFALLAVVLGLGYFAKSGAGKEINDSRARFDSRITSPTIPEENPALVGLARLDAALGTHATRTTPREWTFYDYLGFNPLKLEQRKDSAYRLPRLKLTTQGDASTGVVTLAWMRDESASPDHPAGGQFTLELMRYDLAVGPQSATALPTSNAFESELAQSVGSTGADLQPGSLYGFFVRAKVVEGLKLIPGSPPSVESNTVQIATPNLFALYSFARVQTSRSTKAAIRISVLGESPIDLPQVSVSTLTKAPLMLDATAAERLKVKLLPFRPLPAEERGRNAPLPYYDLQRGFFGMLYPKRIQNDLSAGAAPPPGGSGTPAGPEDGGEGTEEGGEGESGEQPAEKPAEKPAEPPEEKKPENPSPTPPKKDEDPFGLAAEPRAAEPA